MTRYELFGGGFIDAKDATDLVERLNENSFMGGNPDINIFMQGVAERCKIQKAVKVRTDSIENFVADLERHEFVKIV